MRKNSTGNGEPRYWVADKPELAIDECDIECDIKDLGGCCYPKGLKVTWQPLISGNQ